MGKEQSMPADMIEADDAQAPAEAARKENLLLLSEKHFDGFVRELNRPSEPGPKLRALLRRVLVWEA